MEVLILLACSYAGTVVYSFLVRPVLAKGGIIKDV
jgi:hypothetical protein